jgi:hypothetical protein
LNPDVTGDFIIANVDDFVHTYVELIKKYDLIIANDINNVHINYHNSF